MMPAIDPRYDARRKRARVAVFITAGTITVSSALGGTRFSGWRWLPWALGITLIIVFCAVSMNSGGGPRGRRGMSGLSGRDPALGGRLGGLVAHRWHGLVMVSRMMPGPAGRRWLYAGMYAVRLTKDQVAARLSDAGLHAVSDRHVRQLSGGQQQRLVLSVALVQTRCCCCCLTSQRRARPAISPPALAPHRTHQGARQERAAPDAFDGRGASRV